jgi:hypothetical protein
MNHPHVFAAEIRFEDGLVARRELVAGGAIGDTAESDLTPIGIRQSASAPPANLGDCFTSAGSPVRVAAIEKSPALVVVVADPDPREAMPFEQTRLEGLRLIPLDLGTWMRVLWPVAERFTTTRKTSALLFPPSADVDAKSRRMVWLLTRFYSGRSDEKAPRQMADAVGVAGLDVISGAHRRAVVLVLSRYKDSSTHDAASIRRYLSSIGVPLFVWSITGPRPESRDAWGEIEDISTLPGLSAAAARLRADLASQRVAWVAADSVAALRLQPTGRCAITAMAAR